MDESALQKHSYNLHLLIDRISPIIQKMSEKIAELAQSAKRARNAEMLKSGALKLLVPKASKEEIESIHEMKQKVEEANAAVQAANLERDKALSEMRSALYDKERAEKKQRQAEDVRKSHLDEARSEGRKERQKEWDGWKTEHHDPLVAENKSLKRELAKTKEQLEDAWSDHKIQAVETATGLIQEFGHKIFEDAGLDFTSFPSWNEAKSNLGIRVENEHRPSQGMRLG